MSNFYVEKIRAMDQEVSKKFFARIDPLYTRSREMAHAAANARNCLIDAEYAFADGHFDTAETLIVEAVQYLDEVNNEEGKMESNAV